MTRLGASAAALVLGGAWALAASLHAAPAGELWETRLTMVSSTHGEMAMPPQKICQSAPEANPASMVPSISEHCPGLQQRRDGDRYVWSGACPQGRVDGEIRFVGRDRVEGRLAMDGPEGQFELRFEGERIGPCTPEDE